MDMKKETRLMTIVGCLCAAGCLTVSLINVWESSLPHAEVIPPSEYTVGILPGVSPSDVTGQAATTASPQQKTVNINTASAEEIADVLPGIGKVKAQRIVEYREAAGGFDSVDELTRVKGIGEKTLENIRPYCRLSD